MSDPDESPAIEMKLGEKIMEGFLFGMAQGGEYRLRRGDDGAIEVEYRPDDGEVPE